jgi:polar amino acid transport system substrate-binding protein
MRKLLLAVALTAALASIAEAQKVHDARVADLVQAGTVRLALFLPQYTKNSVTGEVLGNGPGVVAVEVGRALAARLGVKLLLAGYPTPDAVVDCLKVGACDTALIAITPSRTAELGFTPPVVQQDYTYLVPAGSSIKSAADADQPGVRIAVVRNHLSTLALSRVLNRADLVYAEAPDLTFDLLRTGHADVMASARPTLLNYLPKLPGSRVLEDRYGANIQAMAVLKSQAGWLAYFSEFLEEAKASGMVQRAIENAGLRDAYRVVPSAKPN